MSPEQFRVIATMLGLIFFALVVNGVILLAIATSERESRHE
jgi:hypothetical protein